MTPNKQVSPVIRISRGERDASARATHLEAAFEKYSKTTIERKQMSTTTNFKRIALVAVAALGLGVLSSVPANAAINADKLSVSAATAAQTTAETQTVTNATATLSFVATGTAPADSMSVTASLAEFTPATAGQTSGANLPYMTIKETTNASVNGHGSGSAGSTQIAPNTAAVETTTGTSVTVSATYYVYIASSATAAPTIAGTYKVKLTPALPNGGSVPNATVQYITITVSVAAADDTKASAATTTAYLQGSGSTNSSTVVTDSVVAVSMALTSGTTAVRAGFIKVNQLNAAGVASSESLTAEISGPGTLGSGVYDVASRGRALTVKKDDYITIWNDGSSGKATITIKGAVTGAVLATKTVTFYGAMATLTGTVNKTILAVGANDINGTSPAAVSVSAKDSAGTTMNSLLALETIYAFSSDTTIATVPATAVSYSVDSATVAVTGVKAGSATITFGNASTLAASTIKSAPISVRVGSTAVASVTVAFDKATYVPGEKATITLSLKDSTGQLVVPGTYELWASDYGLNFAKGFSQGTAPATTETAVATSALTGVKTYTVYMPVTAGTVTLTGTLAKNLDADYAPVGTLKTAAAIQGTTVTATATVTDSGSAALAAVTALATTVASLRTLIVTLTNLVLKIQKKVKA